MAKRDYEDELARKKILLEIGEAIKNNTKNVESFTDAQKTLLENAST